MTVKPVAEEMKMVARPSFSLGIALGVGALSASAIAAEIALSRSLAVAQSHHFAFLIISIALLGYGAAGTLLSFLRPAGPQALARRLTWGALGFALSLPSAMLLLQRLPFDPYRLAWDYLQWGVVLVYYLVLAVPFGLAGFTIASALQTYASEAPRLYGFDLAGAALGAAAAVVALDGRPVAELVGWAATLGAAAAFAFSVGRPGRGRWVSSAALAGLALLSFGRAPALFSLPMSAYKPLQVALRNPGARLKETLWTPSGRIDRFTGPTTRYAPGLSLAYRRPIPPQEGLTLDGARQSSITLAGPQEPTSAFLEALSSSLVYSLIRRPQGVLVLGAGGGLEVLAAWRAGAARVEAVVAAPEVAELLSRADGSGPAFHETAFRAGNDRLAFQGKTGRYEVIQLALTEQPGPGSTGLYHLSEAYLYTVESFEAMLRALAPGGFLTVTRYILPPPRTELRLVSLAHEALRRSGVEETREHLAAVRGLSTFTLLVGKDALKADQLSSLKDFSSRWGFDLVYYPGMPEAEANRIHQYPEPIYHRLTRELIDPDGHQRLIASYPFDLSPPTDDSPFFFHTFRLRHLPTIYRAVGRKWTALIEGGYLVPLILVQSILASLVLVALAGWGLRRLGWPKGGRPAWVVLYFSALGAGFMGVEIAGLEQAIFLLGQPAYAMAAVLASLLCFAGLGSWLSGRLRPNLRVVCLAVACLAVAGAFLFAPALDRASDLTLGGRFGWVVALMSPLGLLMGMPFPLGLRRLEERRSLVPLAWCANGVCSVVGSVGALNLALGAGFSGVWAASAAAYLLAALAAARLPEVSP